MPAQNTEMLTELRVLTSRVTRRAGATAAAPHSAANGRPTATSPGARALRRPARSSDHSHPREADRLVPAHRLTPPRTAAGQLDLARGQNLRAVQETARSRGYGKRSRAARAGRRAARPAREPPCTRTIHPGRTLYEGCWHTDCPVRCGSQDTARMPTTRCISADRALLVIPYRLQNVITVAWERRRRDAPLSGHRVLPRHGR
jgi:hypothetical protein